LVNSLSKSEDDKVRVFIIGDAVVCGKAGQKTPNRFYNLERMFRVAASQRVATGA
jgi:uncharacterized protein involved in oxidation of intracellular sulfur